MNLLHQSEFNSTFRFTILQNLADWYWRTYATLAYRYCERYGHKWGKGGVGFDGEYTCHWVECARCGYSDSD